MYGSDKVLIYLAFITLASGLEELSRNDALLRRLGLAGKERFVAQFSVYRMTERFMMTYAEMTAQRV